MTTTTATAPRVDAWLFPVVPGAAEERSFVAVLSADDSMRVGELGHAVDRDRAVCARVAARTELGARLSMPPHLVPLTSRGCPSVVGLDVTVSWSHSGEWIALALARDLAVGIDIEQTPDRFDLAAVAEFGVTSLYDFVALEAASKATACAYEGAWPPGVTTRRLAAPHGYVAAVAAPGDAWNVELHMRSPLEHRIGAMDPSLREQGSTGTVRPVRLPDRRLCHVRD
jgi:hypothetical protein